MVQGLPENIFYMRNMLKLEIKTGKMEKHFFHRKERKGRQKPLRIKILKLNGALE